MQSFTLGPFQLTTKRQIKKFPAKFGPEERHARATYFDRLHHRLLLAALPQRNGLLSVRICRPKSSCRYDIDEYGVFGHPTRLPREDMVNGDVIFHLRCPARSGGLAHTQTSIVPPPSLKDLVSKRIRMSSDPKTEQDSIGKTAAGPSSTVNSLTRVQAFVRGWRDAPLRQVQRGVISRGHWNLNL